MNHIAQPFQTPDYMTALEMTTKQAGMQLIMVIVPNKTVSKTNFDTVMVPALIRL